MNLKKAVAAMMAAGMVMTLQPVWAEEAQTEVQTEESQVQTGEEDGSSLDAAAAAQSEAADPEKTQKLDTYYTLALNAINSEDYDTADKYLDICFAYCDPQADPALYADLLLKRACIDVIGGDADMALNQLDAALNVQPDLADAYLVRTQVYSAQGDIAAAVENLEKYIELTEDTSLYETVAQLYEAGGDMDQAAAAYNKYVEGSGEEIQEAGFQNGLYLMEGGRFEEAMEAFEAYAEDETYGAGALYNIGLCRMNLGEYEAAAAAFTSCEEKGGDYEGLYYNRGVSNLLGESWESAIADLEKSVESEPYVEDALFNLGICRMQMEDYENAIAAFTQLIGDGSESEETEAVSEAAEGSEEAAAAAEDPETAEQAEAMTEAGAEEAGETAADPAQAAVLYPGAYYYRAVCEGAIGRLEEAIADYTVCIENGYELSQSYYQRAQVYAALGDTENQTSDLESSLRAAE